MSALSTLLSISLLISTGSMPLGGSKVTTGAMLFLRKTSDLKIVSTAKSTQPAIAIMYGTMSNLVDSTPSANAISTVIPSNARSPVSSAYIVLPEISISSSLGMLVSPTYRCVPALSNPSGRCSVTLALFMGA